jgi:hypothetical protein
VRELDDARITAELDARIVAAGKPVFRSGLPWQVSYSDWVIDVAYAIDDVRMYGTQTSITVPYICVQAHTSASQWTPPLTPALWTIYNSPALGVPLWVQPTGAQDAYDIDDLVHWSNLNEAGAEWVYSSLIPANTTEPGRDGTFDRWWLPVEPYAS